MKDGPHSSPSHPSPSSFCQELWEGLEWGAKSNPMLGPGFPGLVLSITVARELPLGGMLEGRIQQCVCSAGVLPLPKYLSTRWVQAPCHCSSYSADTMVCFRGVLVLPLNYSPNLQQCLRSESLLNGDLGKIFLQKLMIHGVSVVPVFPCLRGL